LIGKTGGPEVSNQIPANCGDAIRMRGLLEDTLPEDEQVALEAHLETCDVCRRAFDLVAAEGRFWDDVRRFAVPVAQSMLQPAETDDDAEPLDFLEPDATPGGIGRFGRYQVQGIVGRGGMGIVLKAFDPGLHRVVAIKVLNPRLATSAAARKRFLREARAAASVAHEHVVTIHAVDESSGLPYLVMQYVAGQSLQQRIDRDGPLELEAILRIGMQTAAGLAAAHAQGLVHRDVKPANILLENGVERVKITDFGLARAVDDASLTQSGVVAGTPQYMAPEQARAEAVDHRSDLFSLGSVLYAMCTGRSPFRADSTFAVLKRVCEDTPRPIREVNASIPDWLGEIVTRLHAKAPAERFPSALEVAERLGAELARLQHPTTITRPAATTVSLERVQSSVGPDFESDPVKQRAPRSVGWRRLAWAAALIALLIGALAFSDASGVTHVSDYLATVLRIPTRDGTLVIEAEPFPAPSWPGSSPWDDSRPGRPTSMNSSTFVAMRFWTGHAGSVKSVTIAPDGSIALSGSGYPTGDATARLWDPWTGREIRSLGGSELGQVLGVAISPDGRRALTCGESPVIRLWDATSGTEIRRLEGHSGPVNAVAFSPDGRRAVSAGMADAMVRLWDLETGREIRRLEGHTSKVFCVAFSPDGKRVASGSEDRAVLVWDVATGETTQKLSGMLKGVESIAFSSDGRRVLAGGQDGIGWLWDVESGRELRRLIGHDGIIASVAFVPGSDRAVTASPQRGQVAGDGTMRMWDVDTGQEIARFTNPENDGFWSVAVAPDGRHAITGGPRGLIRLWKLPEPDTRTAPRNPAVAGELGIMKGHSNEIVAMAMPADGRFALSGGEDFTIRQWDLLKGQETHKLEYHWPISDVAVSESGRYVVAGCLDTMVYFWDNESGSGEPLKGHKRKVRAVAISRDGRFALSGSEENELRYWDLAQTRELRQLSGHSKGTCGVAISPDGRLGLSGSVDGTARLWDLEHGNCLRVMAEGARWVMAVGFMPDGGRCVIGREDGSLGMHDVKDGREARRFAGHRGSIRKVQCSGDGRLILSAGSGALRIWDAATGDEIYQLRGVGGGISCGIILPKEREVLIACYDNTIRLWRLPANLGSKR
jgi:WD40 repeat protein